MVFIVLTEINEDRTEINILVVHAFNTMCFQMKNDSEARIQIFKTEFSRFCVFACYTKTSEAKFLWFNYFFLHSTELLTLSIIVLSSFIENFIGNTHTV